jgi:hypothetical protein
MAVKSVVVIVVHFGDYILTKACIESVMQSTIAVHIVVIDNSMNVSNEKLLSDFKEVIYLDDHKTNITAHPNLIWHKMHRNSGYATAANTGIRLAQKHFSTDYFLVLNNDCTLDSKCVELLIKTYEATKDCGIMGAKVLFADSDNIINSVGGYFNKWTAWQRNTGSGEKDIGQYSNLLKPDYVYGACMFFSQAFLNVVGYMDEHYLLYHEEHDWCLRALNKGYTNYTLCNAVVYHRQGASSGKKIKQQDAPRHILILQYSNIIRFYKKHYPLLLPVAYTRLLLIMCKRLIQGKFSHALLVLSVIFGKRIDTLPAP